MKGTHVTEFLKSTKCSQSENLIDLYIDTKGQRDIPSCLTITKFERSRFKAYQFKKLSTANSRYDKVSRLKSSINITA